MQESLAQARLLVVDDEPANTALLCALLARWGYGDVTATSDSGDVLELCDKLDPDLLFLDLHMPAPTGLDLLRALHDRIHAPVPLPVIMLTADVTSQSKRAALALGARDFLTKPFDLEEVRLRTRNLLEMRLLQREQSRYAAQLEEGVRQRTRHLEQARLEILQRLALAAEYRDDDTGEHTARVAHTSARLAEALGMTSVEVGEIALAAPLHDIGKIALPDSILLKAGPLSTEEYEQMKSHVRVGADILAGSSSELLHMAEQIAATHHERWDGTGYLNGLRGDEIPLVGRIVAVADVFDALTHRRPYKEAWPVEQAVAEVLASVGTHFDPEVVAAFASLDPVALATPSQRAAA
ncbi:MAG TPA: HD domain-containing phosphohydrolase [Thermoleophilaceae bacterium]|nr:HD domain-containing phosphohydrolase [Thermoleophilaceae bacterium]